MSLRSCPLGFPSVFLTGALLFLACLVASPAEAQTQVFFDDFPDNSLDLSKWTVLDGGGAVTVSGGYLRTVGGPDHKRIDTQMRFAPPPGGSVVAAARIRVENPSHNYWSYQKFGFNVNPMESGRGGVGFYFDTYGPGAQGQINEVRALVWAGSDNILNHVVALTWGEFHDWAIEWSDPEVIFYIDGAEVARASYSYTDPLPVGVWNDRPPEMLTDWVEVLEMSRIVAIDIKPGSDPNCFNVNGHGVIPVAILGAADFDVSQIDAFSLAFDGLAVRIRGKRGPLCSPEDSNGDGMMDLVCHFEDDAGYWVGGGDTGTVTGVLYDGTGFEGSDSLCVVP